MRWLGGLAIVLVVLVLGIVGVGYVLPRDHVVTRSAVIPAPPDSVWATITNPAAFPTWRTDVSEVELLQGDSGRVAWRETHGDDAVPVEVLVSEPPARLVTRIASDSLPFGGTWTYHLAATRGGSRVTITEAGSVYNPVYRFVSRFVMGHTSTMDAYLRALGRRFGGTAEPADGVKA